MKQISLYILLILSFSCKNDIDQYPHAIMDLLAVNGDTLIGVKWGKGIVITTDGGKTWIDKPNEPSIKEITIDNKGILWGLNSWIGIHEESYSRLMYSKDFGTTWETIEFKVNEFFPLTIYSKPHENLEITSFENKIYKLTGNNYKTNWTFVDSINVQDQKFIYALPYKISERRELMKQTNKGTWDTLIKIPEISIPSEMIFSKNTLYIAAGGDGGYKAYFATFTNDSTLKRYEMEGSNALGVIKDTKDRIWTFGVGGIYVLQKDKLMKMY